ncbi:MAG: hypothetical protein ACFFDV_09275 [Candidatus Thorarchaeota archaeon]
MNEGRMKLAFPIIILMLMIPIVSTPISIMEETYVETSVDSVTTSSNRPLIVFDYSHGQYRSDIESLDLSLKIELENMGYEVVWAWGGINYTILSNASGLIIGAIWGESNLFSLYELLTIYAWFNLGHKFLWIGTDSDSYGDYINDQMSSILEYIGSHVYPESVLVEDPISNCDLSFRVIANRMGDDDFVSPIVEGVSGVLMHGPTILYGSNSALSPGVAVNPVALETTTIQDIYPLLYYSESAHCFDDNTIPPVVHSDGETGSFVCAALESNLGFFNNSVAMVSGSSPYGRYQPMYTSDYYGKTLEGNLFVKQAINFGMALVTQSTINHPIDITYEEGVPGHFIFWQPFDLNPKSYNITLDDTLTREGIWNSSYEYILLSVDGLDIGEYDYRLTMTNQDNQTLSDSVTVTVVEQQPPWINHPEDFTIYLGDNQSVITWMPSDLSLLYYDVYLDGELLQSHAWMPWESSNVSVHVEGLPLGVHNYTIRVLDFLLLETTDTVMVEVIPTYGYRLDFVQMVILIVSIGSFITIVIVLISKRR